MKLVDAIDEGRIVRVTEEYAIREGLLILRRPMIVPANQKPEFKRLEAERKEKEAFSLDRFRKPLRDKNNVVASLINHFHWQIREKRKQRNMTRKQVAVALNVREIDIKMIENGILPSDDYVLISKIQSYFGINLRKDGQDFVTPMRDIVSGKSEILRPDNSHKEDKTKNLAEDVIGEDIEIIEDK